MNEGAKYVLLTGATGLLGRYLLRDLSLAGVPVAVLVRPDRRNSGEERIQEIVRFWEESCGRDLPMPVCLTGELTEPGLGIDEPGKKWIRHNVGLFLHNAASLTFVNKDKSGDPWRTNVDGTRHVLECCQECGLHNFHYVSTAYVCGKRDGVIREGELDLGQEFRNDYEQSKFESEKLIRGAGFLEPLTVYRPAIIVGDWHTGYTSSYHGLYRYLQFTSILQQQSEQATDGSWLCPIRLILTGEERHNFVPVDWVSAVLTGVVRDPALHGRTYHVVPRQVTRSREVEEALAKYFNFHGTTFVGPDGLPESAKNERERFFYEYISTYEYYLHTEPEFDCTNTTSAFPGLPCPPVDVACILRLIDFGVKNQWGKVRRGKG